MVFKIERFFGTDLPTGAIFYGWFGVCWGFLEGIKNIVDFNTDKLITHDAGSDESGGMKRLVFLLMLALLDIAVSFSLIAATKMRSHTMLLLWLSVKALVIIIMIPASVIIMLENFTAPSDKYETTSIVYNIFMFIMTLVLCYAWIGVFSLYHIFKNEKQHSASGYGGQI